MTHSMVDLDRMCHQQRASGNVNKKSKLANNRNNSVVTR